MDRYVSSQWCFTPSYPSDKVGPECAKPEHIHWARLVKMKPAKKDEIKAKLSI